MASSKLWGLCLLVWMISLTSGATDLFPPPRQLRDERNRRQMMLVPSFIQQAATPTIFFVSGNGAFDGRKPFNDPSEMSSSEELRSQMMNRPPPPRQQMQLISRPNTRPPQPQRQQHFPQEMRHVPPTRTTRPPPPPSSRPIPQSSQEMQHIRPETQQPRIVHRPQQPFRAPNNFQGPFDLHAAAARPERPPPARPEEDPFRSIPPTFFMEDGLPFPPLFEVPPRQVQPPHKPELRPTRPQHQQPEPRPRPPQQQQEPRPRPPQQQQQEPRPRPPQQQPEPRPRERPPQQQFAPPPTRPTTRPTRPTTKPTQTTRRPAPPEESFRHDVHSRPPSETHILPSVLDSLQERDVSAFVPGQAGRDYPLFADAPRTHFRCTQEMVSNFVADVETKCQVVRVCREDGEIDNFLCPNGTLFDEDAQFCNWWYRVPCGDNPGDSNQIPHRGRVVPEPERENRFRERPQTVRERPTTQVRQRPTEPAQRPGVRVRPNGDGRGQSGFEEDSGLDGFFNRRPPHPTREQLAQIPHTQFESLEENTRPQSQPNGFLRGNLDDFFGRPRLVQPQQPRPDLGQLRPTSQETLAPASEESDTTVGLPPTTPRTTLVITTRPTARTRSRPTESQRPRRPFPTRPTEHVTDVIDESDIALVGGFGLTVDEETERPTTRRPIATVRNRGRPTSRPAMHAEEVQTELGFRNIPEGSIFASPSPQQLTGEFDPFFEEQAPEPETTTTTTTEPPTTTAARRRPKTRRTTTTPRPSSTRKTTRKSARTKLTPVTTRFRHRSTSTKRPGRKPTRLKPATKTTTTTTTTTEEPKAAESILSEDDDFEAERPVARKIEKPSDLNAEVQHFTQDPFNSRPEMFSSPFSDPVQSQLSINGRFVSSTPVNFDPFYFGPAVTRDFPGPVSLDELPVAGVLPEDTLFPERQGFTPISSTPFEEPSTIPATTPILSTEQPSTVRTKLRSSKRKGKSHRIKPTESDQLVTRTKISSSTSASVRKSSSRGTSPPAPEFKISTSSSKNRTRSRSKSRSRSRSKSRSRSTTTTEAPDHIASSTERVFATPRSRAQLFPTRNSVMKKTTFGQKKQEFESTTMLSEGAEEAQESNTVTIAETTPIVTTSSTEATSSSTTTEAATTTAGAESSSTAGR